MYFLFIYLFILLNKYSCLHSPPPTLPCPTHPHLSPSILSLFGFVHVSFIHVPWWPLLLPWWPFHPVIPSHLSSGYCQLVLYFNVSGYILLACLFCWLGSNYRWNHMVFVFCHQAYFTYHNALQFHPRCHKG